MLGFQSCNSASYQALCVTQIREATGWFKRRAQGWEGFCRHCVDFASSSRL